MKRCQAVGVAVALDHDGEQVVTDVVADERCAKAAVGTSDWCEEHESEWRPDA